MTYPHVFEPITIRGVYYKNRIELAPPGCGGGGDDNGFVTPGVVEYFRPFAEGGAAIISVGNCSIDITECNDEGPHQLELRFDACIPALSTFGTMCRSYGAQGSMEVNHCGATQGNIPGSKAGDNGFAPSAIVTAAELVRAQQQGRTPLALREMSRQKIEETVQKYADAALRCKKAGMQMLIFHGAHGNLLAQFFSPYFNRRSDEYGGSIRNRARFAIEVLDAARQAVGEDFVIEYRVSADEFAEGHTHFPETLQFIDIIKDKVDILHVSGGLHDTMGEPWHMRPMVQPYMWDWMYNVHFAADIKKAFPNLKVTTVGSIKNIVQAEEIIASGKADFVAMKRALQADPDMPRKYAEGREWEHRPCLRCSCFIIDKYGNFDMGCSVNPFVGRNAEYPERRVQPAPVKKKVAVIGGGPAGITAMQTLLERGHDVTLYEKSGAVGGSIIKAALLPDKKDVGQYLDYLKNQADHMKARVLLNTEATPELVAKENYDAIIVAIGAEPVVPKVPGIDRPIVRWAPDALSEGIDVGENVVIVGAGAIGIEYAIHYAGEGRSVTLVETLEEPTIKGSVAGVLGGEYDLRQGLKNERITLRLSSSLKSVGERSVVITDVKAGAETELPASAVLLSVGMKPRFSEGQDFRTSAPATGVFLVGDCLETGEIRGAVRTAFDIASRI
jgi:2,4-dienoyl-CoA reductase-like NADH-dependent reductase (Old Yellow Enzyme family)/NADPH-dependent 2,4-dienoyl-CoA reductase/sulfur reductase-like enzyme